MKLYHGNIVFSKSRDELAKYRNSYIAGIMQTGAFLLHTFRIYVIIYFADSLVAYLDWDCENQIETNEAGRERKHFSASFFKEEGWR